MTVKTENVAENTVKLTVTVDKEQFNNALDVAFEKVVKDIEAPGFRKGKMPRGMFEKKYGVEQLYQEAFNYLLPIEYPKAVNEAGIDPVAQPEIDIDFENLGKDKDLTFFATVVVKPEVKLGKYKGLAYDEVAIEVTEEEIQKEIDRLVEGQAELAIKEGLVENGDTAVIDFEGFKDGVPFEGGKGANHPLQIGSGSFIPGFEEQLIGLSAGDEKEVEVTFPEEYQAKDLAGEKVTFKVKVHEVKSRNLPELSDELVKDLDKEGIETVEALKADLREKMTKQKEENAKNQKIDQLVEEAANNAEMNIPDAMIESEKEKMLKDVEGRLQQQGMQLDMYLQMTGSDKETLLNQLEGDAKKRLRFNLTLAQIANEENFSVEDEVVNEEIAKIADAYNMEVDQVKQFVNTDDLKEDLKVRKAVDFLVDNAVTK
ncbi:trigger factor [Haloplasma contractile]|uniref:Trigger factor n=1 Tax=Haloplasma contractile SSD-17B TaxID=1033810 RepID=U2FRH2_9MOLU|nr:trigger factor [Haloplasma contractile]ERJ13559.1 Trigger factor protein [Haloplasma contractile SSD-17B]